MDRVTCALCGHRFDPGAATVCSGCPLNKGCTRVCCPNCGYELPPPSVILTWLRKHFLKSRSFA